MALTFYHGHGSPFSWRVFLALEHKRVPYELKVLSFSAGDTRKPEFIAINPRQKTAKAKERLGEELAYLARELRGKFLAGDTPCAADFVLYPEYAYVKRLTFRKAELALTDLVPAALADWGKRIEALPYFDKTYPPHWRG